MPLHLAAVVAWEGSADFYRECAYQGGLYANGFIEPWWENQIEPQRNSPDGDDGRQVSPGIRWSTTTTNSASPIWSG